MIIEQPFNMLNIVRLTGTLYFYDQNVKQTKSLRTQSRLRVFRNNYKSAINFLENVNPDNEVIFELKGSYLAILKDKSFKYCIEDYIKTDITVAGALMAFYEKEILPTYSSHISVEMMGLIQLLSGNEKPLALPTDAILLTKDLTTFDWLKINVKKLEGLLLIDSTISSHTYQIASSLNIPTLMINQKAANKISVYHDKSIQFDASSTSLKLTFLNKKTENLPNTQKLLQVVK